MSARPLKTVIAILFASLCSGCVSDSIGQQAKRLGTDPFDEKIWSTAPQEDRARMVASFLEMHDPRQLTTEQVRRLLGPNTAYYEYDENPAYLIGPKSVVSDYGHGYLLAFVADKATGKVAKIVIIPKVTS